MLIQFSLENFLSFKDNASLSMVAGKRKSKNKSLDQGATFELNKDLNLLKCAVLYGANASGKSNLISALRFVKSFILNSSKESRVDEPIATSPFKLQTRLDARPSGFQVIFAVGKTIFQYDFSVDQNRVHAESLLSVKDGKEVELFTRTMNDISLHKSFKEGKLLAEKTRPNALFLSVCANFNGEISNLISQWFSSLTIISGIRDEVSLERTRTLLGTEKEAQISRLLNEFDLGMERIALSDLSETALRRANAPKGNASLLEAMEKFEEKVGLSSRRAINTYHKVFDEQGELHGEIPFLLSNESEGSQKMIALSGPLVEALENARVIVIDELDARLHPIISKQIIEIFNSGTVNQKNAQLIAATHDTNLLDKDLLRRDQIWFTEKNRYGASHLFSLTEYRVRNDASFEKDYILGKYGAIPLLGNISEVFEPVDQPLPLENSLAGD